MRNIQGWAALVTALLLSAIPSSAGGVPPETAAAESSDGSDAVLLANDGTLPAQGSIALVTAKSTVAPDGPADADNPATPSLAELLGAPEVDLGPAVPAGLPAPPVPAEYLTDSTGLPGLTVEQHSRTDWSGPVQTSTTTSSVVAAPEGVAAIRMSGRLSVPAAGHYELVIAASGAARLVVGDQELSVPPNVPTAQAGATAQAGLAGAAAPEVDGDANPVTTPPLPALATASLALDLQTGDVLDVLVENVDTEAPGLVAFGWRVPADVVTGPVARAVEAAGTADTVVVAVPQPATSTSLALALPADLAELIGRLTEANPRTAVVLDARTDASLGDWAALPGAVLHVPQSGVSVKTTIAKLLRGDEAPRAQLTQAVGPADDPVFEAGHGLAYWEFTVVAVHAVHVPPDAATSAAPGSRAAVTVEVSATGTAPGGTGVEVLASRAGSTKLIPVGEATVEPAPGAASTVVVEVDLTALGPEQPEAWPVRLHVRTPGSADMVTTELAAAEGTPADGGQGTVEAAESGADADGPATAAPVTAIDDGPVATRSSAAAGPRAPAPGGLTMSIADGAAHLDGASRHGQYLQLTGSLPEVTVVDARGRPGPGWSVVAQASELTADAGTVAPRALGWSPVVEAAAAPEITAGPQVPSELNGGPGLGASALLGRADGGSDPGTTRLGAELVMRVPTDTAPGRYAGTLTITLFPSE